MYKYIFIGLILSALTWNTIAQNRKALATEITNKMSFMKNGHEKRQIEFRDDSIYGKPFLKIISKKNIAKDSLRHLLVDNGFYDFNFEHFQINLKNIIDLNESYIKKNYPELHKLISDDSYNKITFCCNETGGGLTVDAIISKNFIEIDNIKEGYGAIGVGYYKEEITYKGISKVGNIFFTEDSSFSKISNARVGIGHPINMENGTRFRITFDVSKHKSKYAAITDESGVIISVIKIY